MTHLSVEEIIDFVSFNELSKDTIDLSAKVNQHICSCPKCFETVSAFQMVYDELCRIGNTSDAKKGIYQLVSENNMLEMNATELYEAMQSFDSTNLSDIAR